MRVYITGIEPIKFTTKDGKLIEGYKLHMTRPFTRNGSQGCENCGKIYVPTIAGLRIGDTFDVWFDRFGKMKGRKIEDVNQDDCLPF